MQASTERNDSPTSADEQQLGTAFGAALGPSGLYVSPTLQQRLDLIEHLIEFGRQIIVLKGEAGSGKSAILGHFASGRRANWYPIRVAAGPSLTATSLLTIIARELDVEHDITEPGDPAARIRQRVASLERGGKVAVLLVDDAEQLAPEAAQAIARLAHAGDQFAELRVLMAAGLDQSALLENLQREHPQHGLVHVIEIPHLHESQVRALIAQRLQDVGAAADDYFSADDYAAIAAASEGRAGRVVTLARQHVAGLTMPARGVATAAGGRGRQSRSSKPMIFALLALGALGLGAWLANRTRPVEPGTSTVTVPLTPQSEDDHVERGDAPPAVGTEPEPAPTAPEPAASPESSVEGVRPPTPEAESAPTPTPTIAQPSPVVEQALAEAPPPPPAPAAHGAPALPPEPLPASEAPPHPANTHAVREPSSSTTAAKAPVKSRPATNATQVAKPVTGSRTFSVEWLLKQPDSGHTLQLFGVRDRHAAERFIADRGIGPRSGIVVGRLHGQPWYVVVYGYYPTRAAAVAAASKLPPALHGTKPWVRSIGSLRAASQ